MFFFLYFLHLLVHMNFFTNGVKKKYVPNFKKNKKSYNFITKNVSKSEAKEN